MVPSGQGEYGSLGAGIADLLELGWEIAQTPSAQLKGSGQDLPDTIWQISDDAILPTVSAISLTSEKLQTLSAKLTLRQQIVKTKKPN